MSLMMNSISPGLIKPSSRRACSSMALGVFAEAPGHFAQLGVLGAGALERAFERGVLAAGLEQRQQTFFAGDRVDDDQEGDEDQRVAQQTATPAGRRGGL